MSHPKNKIINDPIYGFIHIPFDIIWDIIAHPYFQRLRRISQLGLSSLVYPGAKHTRFHHAIGAMHLMNQAIQTLQSKGHKITKKEHKASLISILLHDIGHGPFSHALENSIVDNLSHEQISIMFMNELNKSFKGKLTTAIEIFEKKYEKRFLNQLVSSQLDVDRLDYLNRDSFYSGVNEGIVNSNRIITMLNVSNNELVVDYKGIYSIEKFIIARKLMYWQVYLHKTVLSAEHTLMKILKRAKYLASIKKKIYTTPDFEKFLYETQNIDKKFFKNNRLMANFATLDDADIITCIKNWRKTEDTVLRFLSNTIINRQLLKIKSINKKKIKQTITQIKEQAIKKLKIKPSDVEYLVFAISVQNATYNLMNDEIKLLKKNNELIKLSEIKTEFNINRRNASIIKHYICYPEGCDNEIEF